MSTVNSTNLGPSANGDNHQADGAQPSQEHFALGELVKICVGHERKVYNVHKTLLVNASQYFATSLKACWNGTVNDVEFADHEPALFEAFLDWLYLSKISFSMTTTNFFEILRHAIPLYKLADEIMCDAMANAMVEQLMDIMRDSNERFSFFELRLLREEGLVHTQLYRLALRGSVRQFLRKPDLGENGSNSTEELGDDSRFLKEVLETVRDYHKSSWDDPWFDVRPKYPREPGGDCCDTDSLGGLFGLFD